MKIIFFYLACSGFLFAQTERIVFNHITLETGLPGNLNNVIFEDHIGRIWILSEKYFSIYDGYSFLNFKGPYWDAYFNKTYPQCIEQDTLGNVWLVSKRAIHKYNLNKDRIEKITLKGVDSSMNLYNVTKDSEGYLWMSGESTILRFNPYDLSVKIFRYDSLNPKGLKKGGISKLIPDSKKNMWFSSWGHGIAKLNTQNFEITYFEPSDTDNNSIIPEPIFSLAVDSEDHVWVSSLFTNKKNICVQRLNPETRKFTSYYFYTKNDFEMPNQIFSTTIDLEGNIWFGSLHRGLFKYDVKTKKFSSFKHNQTDNESIGENRIIGLFVDRSNRLWINTINRGIDYVDLNLKNIEYFNICKKINAEDIFINFFKEHASGKIYIGTSRGLFVHDRSSHVFSKIKLSEQMTDVKYGFFISENELFVHDTDHMGIYHVHTGRFEPINNLPYDTKQFHGASIAKDGTVFITNNNSIYTFMNGQIKKKPRKVIELSELGDFGLERQFLVETDKYYFMTFFYNLLKISKSNLVAEVVSPKKPNATIPPIHSIHIMGDSLFLFRSKNFQAYNMRTLVLSAPHKNSEHGMIDEVIPNTKFYTDSSYLIITHFGVFRHKFRSKSKVKLDVFDADKIDPDKALLTKDKQLYLPAGEGFIKFNPLELENYHVKKPRICLSNLYLFNANVTPDSVDAPIKEGILVAKEIVLSHEQSVFALEMKLLNFYDTDHNEYRYMLEGFDKKWNYIGNRHLVQFTSLPSGEYTFKYSGADRNGNWSDTESIKIIVLPPYWETWWFRILTFLSLLLAIFAFVKFRLRAIQKQKEELERQVILRTAEISSQKEEILAQKEEIEHQQVKISELYQEVTDSIYTSKIIQDSILPPAEFIHAHLPDSFVLYEPKDIVSGDFYWMRHEEGITYIAAIDCTGHGVSGAFMSLIAYNLLEKIVDDVQGLDTRLILEKLSQGVIRALHQESENPISKDGMDIALCKIDHKKMLLEFSGANNPLYMIRRGEIFIQKADNNSVGLQIRGKISEFSKHIIPIENGDKFYIFSDGYAGQFGGESGTEKLKYTRFRETLLKNSSLKMSEQKELLQKFFEEWKHG